MQSLATQEQIQSGVPMTFSVEIKAPQTGQQSVENTPTLAKYQVTYGGVLPNEIPQAAQHASEQLSQLAQQEIQQQFQLSSSSSRRFGSGGSSGWGQGSRVAEGGSR